MLVTLLHTITMYCFHLLAKFILSWQLDTKLWRWAIYLNLHYLAIKTYESTIFDVLVIIAPKVCLELKYPTNFRLGFETNLQNPKTHAY